MANIKARRKLSELYAVGVEARFDADGGRVGPFVDADGEPIPIGEHEVAVWVQPPSPLQREQASRSASASRAKAMLRARRDKESEEYLQQQAFTSEMSDETLVEYLVASGVEDRRQEALRDVMAQDEWEDLPAMQDAMTGYQELSEPPTDDPEYDALMEADSRFGDQVAKRERELMDAEREAYSMWSRESLEKKAADQRAEMVGSRAFVTEFERQMQFYAVREASDHGVLFFESARELADSAEEVRATVIEALSKFVTEAVEAKKAHTGRPGSESLELPDTQETSESSTPEVSTE